jgi:hypothetical protein
MEPSMAGSRRHEFSFRMPIADNRLKEVGLQIRKEKDL